MLLVLIHGLPMLEVALHGDGIQIVQTSDNKVKVKVKMKVMDLLSTLGDCIQASFFQVSPKWFRSHLVGNISRQCNPLPPPSSSGQRRLRIS